MSLDLATLTFLRKRDRYNRLVRAVPDRALDSRTKVLLADFGRFFREFPDAQEVTFEPFFLLFCGIHKKLGDEDVAVYKQVIQQVCSKDLPQEEEAPLKRRLHEAATAFDVAQLLVKYEEGQEVDLRRDLQGFMDDYDQVVERKIKNPQVLDPIESLLADEENDHGLSWRWACLNRAMKPLVGGDFGILAGRPDKGKCLHPDTLVRMWPYGVRAAKDIKNGDVVMGPGGAAREVYGTTTGRAPMYRVSYAWGDSYVVNEDHVLSLKRSKAEGKHATGDILNVSVAEYMTWPDGRKGRYKGWKSGVEYPEAVQAMPAYLMGVWLGDGTTDKPQITTTDPEILAAFVARYGPPTKCWNGITYDFTRNTMRGELGAVLGNKHIPKEYLWASRQQRLELLAGLIDSDGYAGDVYELVTKLDVLKDGYVELARSLGFACTATRSFKRATNAPGHAGDWYWRVRIGAEAFGEVPVRLARKRGNPEARPRKRQGLHFGIKVEAVGVGDYAGFCIGGDHLFLLADFTVTHNTTALSDNLTFMAAQVDTVYPGENRSILWFNNEGPGKRIVTRNFQSALNATIEDLVALSHKEPDPAFAKYKTRVRQEYAQALGGRPGVLRVFDVHDMWTYDVEDLMKLHKPALVVFDMIDNIKFGGAAANNGQRTDQLLEEMYKWARNLAVKYDCAALATSQISADGDGMQYPTLGMLKDSKTGKQGAADFIITIGSVNDPMLATSRYIGLTKNKKQRTGGPNSPMQELIIDGQRGRYIEAP